MLSLETVKLANNKLKYKLIIIVICLIYHLDYNLMIINDDALAFLKGHDQKFTQIIEAYGLPPSWSRPQGFETLCKIILEQQVSLESGKAAYEKLAACVEVFDESHIAQLSVEEMRAASISRQKAGYILGLANSILDKTIDLDILPSLTVEEAIEALVSIKGVGPWTAEVYLLFALQAPDIYARGDIALINTIKELWFVKDSSEALEKSKDWSPHRSAASFLLWHYYLSKRGRVNPIESL